MTLTIHYPATGVARTYRDLTPSQVNKHITYISNLRVACAYEFPILIEVAA